MGMFNRVKLVYYINNVEPTKPTKMYHMEDRDSIILAYRREGKSIREIARQNGMSRKTVRKYLRQFEKAVGSSPTATEMDDYLQQPVIYDSSKRVRRVMNETVRGRIDDFIAKNRANKAAGLHKQQMLKIDMWRRLRDEGVDIAYSTVCQYVRALEAMPEPAKMPKGVFIRQSYEPGERCEFDWGTFYLWIDSVKTKLHMAVFTLNHSNMRIAYLFSREDTLALMEAHRNCFRLLGGTPKIMAYDNMRTVVKKFLGREREHTDALRRMEVHYCFTPHFCNPRSGWEKGKVERSVENVRRRAFSYDTHFKTLEEAQAHLLRICDRLNAEASDMSSAEKQARVRADINALRPLDHGDMGCFEQRHARVGKYSTITVEGVCTRQACGPAGGRQDVLRAHCRIGRREDARQGGHPCPQPPQRRLAHRAGALFRYVPAQASRPGAQRRPAASPPLGGGAPSSPLFGRPTLVCGNARFHTGQQPHI